MQSIYLKIFLIAFAINTSIYSQNKNLVLNPSFEKTKPGSNYPSCAYAPNNLNFDNTVSNWNTWAGMTPDYIIWQPDEYGDCFFPRPHTGKHAVGIINYLPAVDLGKRYDFHEYINGQLRFPLAPGRAYKVELYIQQADSVAIDHLQVIYGEKQDIKTLASGNLGICFLYNKPRWLPKDGFQPQVLFKDPIITKKGEWKKISATFVPDRAFLFFVVGNFFKDENTRNTLTNNDEIRAFNETHPGFSEKKKRISYYVIDDFSVTLTEMPTARSVITETLAENSVYIFKNVNFETNKWELLPEALPELKALAAYLLEHPGKQAEIAGHTDNVGNKKDNRVLSEKRAEAVYKYLVFKGMEKGRLSFKGYGEQQPIEPNTTAKGRAANRRVECRLK